MILHVVTFVFGPGATEAEVAEITAGLRALPEQLDVLLGYDAGPDAGLTPGTGDFAVVARVADEAGLRTYAEYPPHQELAARLRAIASSRTAVQIRTA